MTRIRSELGWQWAVRCPGQPEHELGPLLRAAGRNYQFSWPQLTELEHGRLGVTEVPPPGASIWLLCSESSGKWVYLLVGYTDDVAKLDVTRHPLFTIAKVEAGAGTALFVAFCPYGGGARQDGEATVRAIAAENEVTAMYGPHATFVLARTPLAERGRVVATLPSEVNVDEVRAWDGVDDTLRRVHE